MSRFQQEASTTGESCARQHPCLADAVLHRCLMQCHYLGVVPSTRWTYQLLLTAFNTFCHQFGIVPFPASSLILEYFCAHASQQISYKTLKVYLSRICRAHLERGLPDTSESISLHLVRYSSI